jgi:hypothetical protein
MLDFARTLGVTEGVSYFRLDCAADNAPLTQIYRTYGFDHAGNTRPGYAAVLSQRNESRYTC